MPLSQLRLRATFRPAAERRLGADAVPLAVESARRWASGSRRYPGHRLRIAQCHARTDASERGSRQFGTRPGWIVHRSRATLPTAARPDLVPTGAACIDVVRSPVRTRDAAWQLVVSVMRKWPGPVGRRLQRRAQRAVVGMVATSAPRSATSRRTVPAPPPCPPRVQRTGRRCRQPALDRTGRSTASATSAVGGGFRTGRTSDEAPLRSYARVLLQVLRHARLGVRERARVAAPTLPSSPSVAGSGPGQLVVIALEMPSAGVQRYRNSNAVFYERRIRGGPCMAAKRSPSADARHGDVHASRARQVRQADRATLRSGRDPLSVREAGARTSCRVSSINVPRPRKSGTGSSTIVRLRMSCASVRVTIAPRP